VPVKTKINVGLIQCGKCGKRYSNPLNHTCYVRRQRGKTRVKPKLNVTLGTCGKCGKAYGNPLTHVCKDFKGRAEAQRKQAAERRKEAAERRKEAERSGPKRQTHNYVTCRDPDCERKTCEAFRDGYRDGFEDGRFT
jgi:hypothetical protein